MEKNLYTETRHLHHEAETHEFAKAMVEGTLTDQQWTDWLGALQKVHFTLDPYVPIEARCTHRLQKDLMIMTPIVPRKLESLDNFITTLDNPVNIGGAAYIFIAAHKRGGRVIEKAMREKGRNLPNNHVFFENSKEVELYITELRNYIHLTSGAEHAFSSIISIFDEIWNKDVHNE
jgi:hypothetical protein